MKNFCRRLSTAVVLLLSFVAAVPAQGATVQGLERQLRERDKVILELLDRVEALERRLGVHRPAAPTSEPPPADEEPSRSAGPAPGLVEVDARDAERALERALTREGALLLPSGVLEIETRLTYARQEDTAPSFVPDENELLFAGEMERNADNLTALLGLRLGLPRDSQLELGLPYRWRTVETVTNVDFIPRDASRETGSGFGDLRLGVAKTLLHEGLRRPDLIGRLTWDTDTGKSHNHGVALGGGYHELRGALTALKRQDPIVFVGGLAYEYSFEKDRVQSGATLSGTVGCHIALSPETSLSLFLLAARQGETELSGSKLEGSDRTLGSVVLGGSTLLAPGTLLGLSGGIGLTDDAEDFSLSLSLTNRFDQPFF